MKIIKKGQYKTSEETFEGTKKEVLSFLRDEALEMRKKSRSTMSKDKQNVHSILHEKHQSELVNLASFKIKKMNIEQLLPLMNNYGVMDYKILE